MKNLLYLCLIFLVLGCGSDDESSLGGPINALPKESTLLTLNVGDMFSDDGTRLISGHVYLTDEEGKLLIDTNLVNDNNYELKSYYDYANRPYDLTMVYQIPDIYFSNYDVTTFVDVDPLTLEMSVEGFNSEDAEVNIKIQNTGATDYDLWGIGNSGNATLSCSEIDGGSCDLNIRLQTVPDNIYASFQKSTEDIRRYICLEDIDGPGTYSFDYADIPEITDLKTISYPSGSDYLWSDISGYLLNSPDRFHNLSRRYSSDGATQMNHYYPQNIFDGYRVIENFENADTKYYSKRIEQDVKSTYDIPDLDFQINNNRIENYSSDALSSSYDYYLACFHFRPITDIGVSYKWSVYGKSEEDINFSMSNISELLFERLNHSGLTLDDFELVSFRICNLNGGLSYKEITKSVIETFSDPERGIDFLEYVEKRY